MREKPSRINPVSWAGQRWAESGEPRNRRDIAMLRSRTVQLDHCPYHKTAISYLHGHETVHWVICVSTIMSISSPLWVRPRPPITSQLSPPPPWARIDPLRALHLVIHDPWSMRVKSVGNNYNLTSTRCGPAGGANTLLTDYFLRPHWLGSNEGPSVTITGITTT